MINFSYITTEELTIDSAAMRPIKATFYSDLDSWSKRISFQSDTKSPPSLYQRPEQKEECEKRLCWDIGTLRHVNIFTQIVFHVYTPEMMDEVILCSSILPRGCIGKYTQKLNEYWQR